MDTEERKKWLKWSKIGICVPLKDKHANEKDIHMATRLVNLQEEMATNFNNFLRVQPQFICGTTDSQKEKIKRAKKQTC